MFSELRGFEIDGQRKSDGKWVELQSLVRKTVKTGNKKQIKFLFFSWEVDETRDIVPTFSQAQEVANKYLSNPNYQTIRITQLQDVDTPFGGETAIMVIWQGGKWTS